MKGKKRMELDLAKEELEYLRKQYKVEKELNEICSEIYREKINSNDREIRKLVLEALKCSENELNIAIKLGKKALDRYETLKQAYKEVCEGERWCHEKIQ